MTKAGDRTGIAEINLYSTFADDSIAIARRSQIGIWSKGTVMEPQFPPYGVADYEFAEMFVSSKGNIENLLNLEYKKQVDSLKYEAIKRCR